MNIITQEARKKQAIVKYAERNGSHLFATQRKSK